MDRVSPCPIPITTDSSFPIPNDESAFPTTATSIYYSTTAGSTGTSNAEPKKITNAGDSNNMSHDEKTDATRNGHNNKNDRTTCKKPQRSSVNPSLFGFDRTYLSHQWQSQIQYWTQQLSIWIQQQNISSLLVRLQQLQQNEPHQISFRHRWLPQRQTIIQYILMITTVYAMSRIALNSRWRRLRLSTNTVNKSTTTNHSNNNYHSQPPSSLSTSTVTETPSISPQLPKNHNNNDLWNDATLVPISYLLKLLLQPQHSQQPKTIFRKFLIGTNRILFQTDPNDHESNASWSRVELPKQHSTLYQHLLSLITSLVVKHYSPVGSSNSNNNYNNSNGDVRQPQSNIELSVLPEDLDDIHNHRHQSTKTNDGLSIVTAAFVACIPFLYLALVYRIIQKSADSSSGPSSSIKDNHDIHSLIHTNSPTTAKKNRQNRNSNTTSTVVTFADVAGIDDAVRDMQQIVQYVQNPIMYQKYGAHVTRGILLHGPPGSGKTLLVRALSQEIQQQLGGSCPVIACAASSFVELYVGRGAARVRQLFQLAQQRAVQSYQQQYSSSKKSGHSNVISQLLRQYVYSNQDNRESSQEPVNQNCCMAILFIDELDALAKTRSGSKSFPTGNDEREQTLNQLLTEMDGFHTSTTPSTTANRNDHNPTPIIIVIGATNRVDVLDPAILRRFDRHIHVPHPNHLGRKRILQIHARHIPLITTKIDWDALATLTHDMSGSDLQQIVNEAALLAVRESYDRNSSHHIDTHDAATTTTGSSNHCVTQHHLEFAIQRHRQRSGQVRK